MDIDMKQPTNMKKNESSKPKLRVVIVDDEPLIIMNLTESLTCNGYEVVGKASDGFEAINVCTQMRPDIVLMDVKMPLLDGLRAAEYIFKMDYAETIVMITAFGEERNFIEKAAEIGVSGYLVKPIDVKTLIPTIDIAVARSKERNYLKSEVQEAYKHVEARKKIERAKSHLMQQRNFSEKEAFEYIRHASREHSMAMEKVAEILLFGEN